MAVGGTTDPWFAPVGEALAEVVENAAGTGAAVAAWYDGEWVVDLWSGWADADRTRRWERDSIASRTRSRSRSLRFARSCSSIAERSSDLVFGHDVSWGLGFSVDRYGYGMGRHGRARWAVHSMRSRAARTCPEPTGVMQTQSPGFGLVCGSRAERRHGQPKPLSCSQ
jgi:hypothetical protein